MTQPAGGLRNRLIGEAVFRCVRDGLDALGWNDTEGKGLTYPFNVLTEPVADDDEVPLNSLGIAAEDVNGDPAELGTESTIDRHVFYIDFFGETDWVARHVSGDVRDILRGRFPAIGRVAARIVVVNYAMATPVPVFAVSVDEVVEDAAHGFTQPWRRHWRSVRVEVSDEYWTDLPDEGELTWEDLAANWVQLLGIEWGSL